MAHLPFLIVYGAWVWKLVLAGFVALCAAALAWVRRWIAQNDGAFAENQLLWWRLGAGELVPTPVLCADEPGDCPFGAALQAAEHGDGGPLADAARRYGHDWTTVADEVLAVAPRVTAHRAELAAALHAVPATTSVSLFDFIETAAARRDIARLLGDTAVAAQWQAVVARFDAVLADRQKAIALVLLEPQ